MLVSFNFLNLAHKDLIMICLQCLFFCSLHGENGILTFPFLVQALLVDCNIVCIPNFLTTPPPHPLSFCVHTCVCIVFISALASKYSFSLAYFGLRAYVNNLSEKLKSYYNHIQVTLTISRTRNRLFIRYTW